MNLFLFGNFKKHRTSFFLLQVSIKKIICTGQWWAAITKSKKQFL